MTTFTAEVRTLYFIRPVGERGPVKIGCSRQPAARRQQLQAGMQRPLEIIATFPGSIDDEHRIQSLFWHDRTYGEWFKPSRGLQILMDAAARGELDIEALPPARLRTMPERRGPKGSNARQAVGG